MPTTAAIVTAVGSVASAGISASQASKTRKAAQNASRARAKTIGDFIAAGGFQPDREVEFRGIGPVERTRIANEALTVTERAVPRLGEVASQINQQSTRDVIESLDEFFGGRFGEAVDSATENLINELRGQVSPGTQRILARQALAGNINELGRDSVRRNFAGFLGLASEDIAQRGQANLRANVATFRQAVPITSTASLLPFGAPTVSQLLSVEQFNRAGEFQADSANVTRAFQGQLAQANALLGAANAGISDIHQANLDASQLTAQAGQQLVSGLTGAIGAYQETQRSNYIYQADATSNALSVPVDQRGDTFVALRSTSGQTQYVPAAKQISNARLPAEATLAGGSTRSGFTSSVD